MKIVNVLTFPFLLAVTLVIASAANDLSFSRLADVSNSPLRFTNIYQTIEHISRHPRPLGSQAHEKTRQFIINELNNIGVEVDVQVDDVVSEHRVATVHNVIARIAGKNSDEAAVMLMSHYDSARLSHGASDAGYGVASMLEIARVLSQAPAPTADIVLLFSDGEEYGLLGATAFFERHPLAKDIGFVLNLEARGSSGPLLMFETGDNNQGIIESLVSAGAKPVADSLFSQVYSLMPNSTDFRVVREHGIQGLNFAFIDSHYSYHSPADNYANIDRQTVARAAQTAYVLATHYAEQGASIEANGNKGFFIFAGALITYDAWFGIAATLILSWLLFVSVTVVVKIRGDQDRVGKILSKVLLGGVAVLLQWGVTLILAQILVMAILRLLSLEYHDQVAADKRMFVFFWLLAFSFQGMWLCAAGKRLAVKYTPIGFFVVAIILAFIGLDIVPSVVVAFLVSMLIYIAQRMNAETNYRTEYHLCGWLLVALLLSALSPLAVHAVVLPALLYAITYFIVHRFNLPKTVLWIGVFLALILWTNYVRWVHLALGSIAPGLIVLLGLMALGLTVTLFLSHIQQSGWRSPASSVALAAALLLSLHLLPPYGANTPRPNSVYYLLDQYNGEAFWLSEDKKLDDWVRSILSGDARDQVDNPLNLGRADVHWRSPAPLIAAEPTPLNIISSSSWSEGVALELIYQTNESAHEWVLQIENHSRIAELSINGHALPTGHHRDGWLTVNYVAPAGKALMIRIKARTNSPLTLRTLEIANDFPSEFSDLDNWQAPARQKHTMAKPHSFSDTTIVLNTYQL